MDHVYLRSAVLTWIAVLVLPCLPARGVSRNDPLVDEVRPPTRWVPGQVLIKLADTAARLPPSMRNPGSQDTVLDGIQKRTGTTLSLIRPLILGWGLYWAGSAKHDDAANEDETEVIASKLAHDQAVAGVTLNRWYRPLRVPTDPGYDVMWHLDAIGAAAAWDITTGLSEQRVGVVDTGSRRDHEELTEKDIAGYDFISDSNQAADGDGRDADYEDEGDGGNCGQGYQPDSWHGSHVAGTILAAANNGRGIPGINWAAKLVTARALGKCGGALADIMEASAWLAGANIPGIPSIGENQVSVMNLSLGGAAGCSAFEQEVIDFINDRGVIFVAAAGNDGGAVGSPANCLGVVTVAAHGPGANRPLTQYSSFGGSVEIVAPGGAIQNAAEQGVLSLSGVENDAYVWQQGTSMAAPHVAGAISLMLALNPTLSRTEINALMQEQGDDCEGCQGKKALRIDRVLQVLGDSTSPPPPAAPPPPVDDLYEENDSADAAVPLSCGATESLYTGVFDLDWFVVSPPAGTNATFTLDAGAVDLDLFVTLEENPNEVWMQSTSETGQEQLVVTGTGAAIYLVIAPWQSASGAYTLTIGCEVTGDEAPTVPPESPEISPDDVVEQPAEDQPDSATETEDRPVSDDVEMGTPDEVGGAEKNPDVSTGCSAMEGRPGLGLPLIGLFAVILARGIRRRRHAWSVTPGTFGGVQPNPRGLSTSLR